MATTTRRAPRRSGEDSRDLLLQAARRLFGERGYAQTGTRDIAAHAGVPERLIFRHFGGKRELFDLTAKAEISAFLEDFVDSWRRMNSAEYDLRSLTNSYVTAFSRFTRDNARLLIDLMALHETHTAAGLAEADVSPFGDLFDGLETLARTEAERHGYPTDHAGRHVRFTIALVMATVLLSDVFYRDPDERVGNQVTADLAEFILGAAIADLSGGS